MDLVDSCTKCSRHFSSAVPAIFCDICKKMATLKMFKIDWFSVCCIVFSMPYFCHACFRLLAC